MNKRDYETLSVIMPTYNRPHFLARSLQYFQEQNFSNYPIVVADSSAGVACEANRAIVDSASATLRIDYKRYPEDTYLYSKIAQALDETDSTYSVICGDDDIFAPRAIEKCAKFLGEHEDYEVAHGRILALYALEPIQHGRLIKRVAVGRGIANSRVWGEYQTTHSVEMDDPQERFRYHLLNYEPTYYSVHRRANLIRYMQLSSTKAKDYFLAERLSTCLAIINGKMKLLDHIYAVRAYHQPDSTSVKTLRMDLPDLLVSDDFSMRYVNFRETLANELARNPRLSLDAAMEEVNRTFLAYVVKYLNRLYSYREISQSSRERAVGRVWKVIQALPVLANFALSKSFLSVLKSPVESGRFASVITQHRYIPIDRLLRQAGNLELASIHQHVQRDSGRIQT
jgi:glycosyltransferase domain-containing protein